jgi:ZIP family zinc transporter
MAEWFAQLHPVVQALLATLFTWGVTALGAANVFFFKKVQPTVLNGMLGFAAGVMIAASYWSLLAPAITLSAEMGSKPWVPPLIGFLAGGACLWAIDKILPHLHPGLATNKAEGIKTQWQRSALLVLAITMHNIPEGMAVGVAFGALADGTSSATLGGAVALAVGIGLQNYPEGVAVAVPLRREGMSRRKCFWYGQLSAIVEPIGGVIAAATVIVMKPILPYALAFAAGAMIYVVVEELIPEAQRNDDTDTATIGAILGFALMMTLDVALG